MVDARFLACGPAENEINVQPPDGATTGPVSIVSSAFIHTIASNSSPRRTESGWRTCPQARRAASPGGHGRIERNNPERRPQTRRYRGTAGDDAPGRLPPSGLAGQ